MDILSIVVGALIGALFSVPITIFIQDPLRAFMQRALIAWRRSSHPEQTDLVVHVSVELKKRDELEGELKLVEQNLERAGSLLASLERPKKGET